MTASPTSPPIRWPTARLTEVADLVRGVSYPKDDSSYEPRAGYVPILRATNIQSGRLITDSDLVFVAGRNISQEQMLRPGDIVVATSSGSKHLVGKSGLLTAPWLGSFGAFCAAIRPKQGIDARYLALFLQAPLYWSQITKKALGVNINNLRRGDLEAIEMPLPALSIQQRLVAELEMQFSRLDDAAANIQSVKANLGRYKASVLKAAVEGRLVPTEAELADREARGYESATELLKHSRRTRSTRKLGRTDLSGGDEAATLPTPPEGWEWTTPEELATSDSNSICAGPFGTLFKAKDFRTSGVPIIFLRHVAPGRYLTHKPGFMDGDKWQALFKPYSVFGGELLITKLGEPPGVCALYPMGIGPAMVTPDVIKMSVNSSIALPKYLMHYFNSGYGRSFATGAAFGTTRMRLTLPIFRSMPIPLPPLAEQTRIVAEIEVCLSVVDSCEAEIETMAKRVASLRAAILERRFASRHSQSNRPPFGLTHLLIGSGNARSKETSVNER